MSIENTAPVADEQSELFDSIVARATENVEANLKKSMARKGAVSIPAVAKEDDWDFSEWVTAVGQSACKDGRREKALNLLANKYGAKDLVQGTTTTGGFLVPEQWEQNLYGQPEPTLALVNHVTTIPMNGAVLKIPVLDQTVTPSGGTSAFYAGLAMAAITEANAPSETNLAFKQVSLTAIKLGAVTQVSTELLENSNPAIASILGNAMTGAVNAYKEYQIINGSTFTGIVGHAATIAVPRASANRVKLVDLAKMYERFIGKRPLFVFNKSVTSELFTLEDANGNNVMLPNMNVSGGVGATIFGVPYVFSQYNPVLGSEGDCMLVDGDSYILGENKGATLSASEHFAFTSDLITYRLNWRGMAKPMLTAPIKLADGTFTVSPFVVLDDATS